MKSYLDDIDINNWRKNREELARLNGSDFVIMFHPIAIGKTEMWNIANQLAAARKNPIFNTKPN